MATSRQGLRVLSVIPSVARNTGGTATFVLEVARAMRPRVEHTILATDAAAPASGSFRRLTSADLAPEAHALDVRVFPTRPPYSWGFSPGLLRAARHLVRKSDLVAIHSLNLFPQLAAFLTAKGAATPYIVTPHGSLDPWLRAQRTLRKAANDWLWQERMLRGAAAIHFTTDDEARIAAADLGDAPRWIVPNGIPFERFRGRGDPARFRNRYLDGYQGPLVLFHGRIAAKKGIDVLLRAVSRLPSRTTMNLAVVGPDDEGLSPGLLRLADELAIRDRVHLVGPLYGDDQLDALAAADIWALTSHTENFGIAVLEAMAAGLPVLISQEVNIAHAVTGAEAGLVTSLDVDEIAGKLDALLSDRELRGRIADKAVAFAARYDWGTVSDRLYEMYATVCARKWT